MLVPSRPFLRALAVSLFAHACVLVGVTRLEPLRYDFPAPVSVALSRLGGAHAQFQPSPEPLRPLQAATSLPTHAESGDKSRKPVMRVAESPKAEPVRSVPDSAAREDKGAVPVQAPSSGGVAASTVATTEAAGNEGRGAVVASASMVASKLAVSGQDGVSANDVRQYRTSLAVAARRFKRYPPLAKEQGWEGTVEVAVDFRKRLPDPDVLLAGTGGHRVLDDQALDMIRQAVRVAEIPDGLRGRDFRTVLPIRFSLEDER